MRAVLFDFGNTLFAHAPLAETIGDAAEGLGHPLSGEACAQLALAVDGAAMAVDEVARGRDLDGDVWRARWRVLYGALDVAVPGLGAAVDRSMHDPDHWLPYATTVEVLTGLHGAGIPVGVVSNTGWDVPGVFARWGLDGMIDTFVLSFEVGAVKPDPAVFLLAAERLGTDPGEVLMVGDDPRADSGALAVGMPVLLLPSAPPRADNGLGAVLAIARRADDPGAPSAPGPGRPR